MIGGVKIFLDFHTQTILTHHRRVSTWDLAFVILPTNILWHCYALKTANRIHDWIIFKQSMFVDNSFYSSCLSWNVPEPIEQFPLYIINVFEREFSLSPSLGLCPPAHSSAVTNESCLSAECSSQLFLVFDENLVYLFFLIFFLWQLGLKNKTSQSKRLTALENESQMGLDLTILTQNSSRKSVSENKKFTHHPWIDHVIRNTPSHDHAQLCSFLL